MARRVIIGDSLVSFVCHMGDTDIISLRGAQVQDITSFLQNIDFQNYSSVIFCCGTNNIQSDYVKTIFTHIEYLVQCVKALNPNITVIISSLLPRLVDDSVNGHKVILLNQLLQKFSVKWDVCFIPTYKLFLSKGIIQASYFHRDHLHLSKSGVQRIRQYFSQKFSQFGFKARQSIFGATVVYSRSKWTPLLY